MLVTVALTLLVATQLPDPGDAADRYDTRLVDLTAGELRNLLHANDPKPLQSIAMRRVLDFDKLMQIYVINPQGRDALDRRLPWPVKRLLNNGPPVLALKNPRLRVHHEGLGGYWVIGYQIGFPLGRVLVRPGARTIMIVIALTVSALVSFFLARYIVLPVRRLRIAGQQVANGDLSVRVAHTVSGRSDDIAQLARDFDLMTERVDRLLSSQQRLMRDVSHELRSPLARLQALQSLARQQSTQADQSIIDRMDKEAERLNELIGEILEYARLEVLESLDQRATDLVDLLHTIAADADLEGQSDGKSVSINGPEACLVSVDSALLHAALENIIRNALKYTAANTEVRVSVERVPERIIIRIDDHGPGVPAEQLDRLFEPFFRIEASRPRSSGGTGVGLAIAERSIKLHGGSVSASNRATGGLSIKVSLPQA